MYIKQVKIKGFRNFKEDIINFNNKTLIIGENDVGKTNLIYALRILLDKSLTEYDIEPKESDFYVYENTRKIEIQIKFADINEDCIYSYFKGNISEDNELVLKYEAFYDDLSYNLLQGKDENSLKIIESNTRYYLKVLNIQYVSGIRDLKKYIAKEKKKLIQLAKNNRNEDDINKDKHIFYNVESYYNKTNKSIEHLTYVNNATNILNDELKNLSTNNDNLNIKFNMGDSDIDSFINDLELVSNVKGKSLKVGGDGRNNQIFLSLWATKNKFETSLKNNVTINIIEEPESHLHPHNQRKLANYLVDIFENQVIITTHSPQIACEFKPGSIIKLTEKNYKTIAENNGCSNIIEDSLIDFAYRLNIISAETFFSKAVFLVEGISEVLFYKALQDELGIDLDKYNISILSVEGVGFDVYIDVLKSLGINYIVRTDNDIIKVPKKTIYRCAGILRCIEIYHKKGLENTNLDKLIELYKEKISNLENNDRTSELKDIMYKFTEELNHEGIFLSNIDLENDLANSEIYRDIKDYLEENGHRINDINDVVNRMQDSKGMFMYNFLRERRDCLKKLKDSEFVKQLNECIKLVGDNKND